MELTIDLTKSITRDQAKQAHSKSKLPDGGTWRTVHGHHIYIVKGKIVAGAFGENGKAKKSTKEHMDERQKHVTKQSNKAKADKSKTTKATNKANAHGKTGAAKVLPDPTKGKAPVKSATKTPTKASTAPKPQVGTTGATKAKAPKETIKDVLGYKPDPKAKTKAAVAKQEQQRKDYNKKMKADKKARDAGAKPIIKTDIKAQNGEEVRKNSPSAQKEQASAVELKGMMEGTGKEENVSQIDRMWMSDPVQKIMAKPPEKRTDAEVKKIANDITVANDKLARSVVLKMGEMRGLHLANQVNEHGQETNYYGDMLQTARLGMLETMHAIVGGSQKLQTPSSIGAHVVNRMKQAVDREMQKVMNDIPVPEEIRPAIGDMRKAEGHLGTKLGRTPTHEEVAEHLQKTSRAFKDMPIVPAPVWDEAKGDWVAQKKRISDPNERLRMLKIYAARQKASSMDVEQTAGHDAGDKVSKHGVIADDSHQQMEDHVDALDRDQKNKELQTKIPAALKDMGFNDKERKVFLSMFATPSEKTNDSHLTQREVAEKHNMTRYEVAEIYKNMMDKLSEAHRSNHPALQQLAIYRSIHCDLMKALYEYDLVKSMTLWGIGTEHLEERFVRVEYADSADELQKSLDPTEYVGTLVTTEDGKVHARIVELVLPEDNMIFKAFMDDRLQKSLFPHKGKAHEVNAKATEYAKANGKKLKELSERQHASAKGKGAGHSWSVKLLLDNPGSAWITWGGKKILINAADGKILYDSGNEAHRAEQNKGADESKIDFHHEQEALDEHNSAKEEGLQKKWKDFVRDAETKANSGKNPKAVAYDKLKESFLRGNPDAKNIDFEGNDLKYKADSLEDSHHVIDHGVAAFKDEMGKLREQHMKRRAEYNASHSHMAHDLYADLSEDERKKVDGMSDEEKRHFFGSKFMEGEGVKDALRKYHQAANTGSEEEAEAAKQEAIEALKKAGSVAARNTDAMNSFFHGAKGDSVKKLDPDKNWDTLTDYLGQKELTRAGEEASKKFLPEGKYLIGNPLTGQYVAVDIGAGFDGGVNSRGGKFTLKPREAFDPSGGKQHEDITSWASLAKVLGFKGKDATDLQVNAAMSGNKDETKPMIKPLSEEEYQKHRANSKVGLQEGILHKDFKLVNQTRAKDGSLQSSTYAMKMPDGSENHIDVDAKGYIQDPVMARLVKQRKPIQSAEDLHDVMKNAVGNRAWVTAHFGSDIHIGDALDHHVQLEYDGKGAPRVVGGNYDGYRFMDAKDVPKGAVDPATGEPIKALFKNGKLIDRKFNTKHDVPFADGNEVLFPNGKGGFRKGTLKAKTPDGDWIVKDTDGFTRVYKENELKHAKREGHTVADSGMAAVRLSKHNTHRLDTSAMDDKQKKLLEQALDKAKITRSEDGKYEWRGDSAVNKLRKKLGNDADDILQHMRTASTKELEIHVPKALRSTLEHYGVKVGSEKGTAKISVGKFEELRDALGGLSVDHNAMSHLQEHFNRKDRVPKTPEELQKGYQPSSVDKSSPFGQHYQDQFKKDSFLMKEGQGLYGTQLEGVSHLVDRGRALVGHGMGVGKTITGVTAAAHYKAKELSEGRTPKKTLVVSPAGIRSDWGKEIGSHTNMKALYVGTPQDRKNGGVKGEDGKWRWGQKGTEQEHVLSKDFMKNMAKHASEDHDFHVMSYDQFMKNREALANSGMYDNIIVDEIHAFKNKGGERGKALSETTDKFKNVWGLSGTPMENDAKEMHSLIDTITGGRHELGNLQEFTSNYMMKDKNGKVTGIKPTMAQKLGDILANIVQFRDGKDVTYADGSKIEFPQFAGAAASAGSPNPKTDFIGNMVDRSRDHKTTDYYGTKHSITDYESGSKTVKSKSGEDYEVQTHSPVESSLSPALRKFYDDYRALQDKHLPASKLQELATASATGQAKEGAGGNNNFLTGHMLLQKYINAPHSARMYVPGANSALESADTNAQAEKPTKGAKTQIPFETDEHGHKRYYEADGKGGYLKNADGSPKLLPPLHHDNPKAMYLKKRLGTYLDNLARENTQRRQAGKPELMPKAVIKSEYTTFGTDIIENVLRDLQREHPELQRWQHKVGDKFGFGRFTGDADDREQTKTGFRGDKKDYANKQGHLWATTVSPAGKEGVDFGNAHIMFHYDQNFNPQKMAQFTARVRRSDSGKSHAAVDRANSVRVESLHVPGTVEDFVFNAQDSKMENINKVVQETRHMEQSPKYGDSQAGMQTGHMTKKTKKASPKGATPLHVTEPGKRPEAGGGVGAIPKPAAAVAAKSIQLVVII